MLQIKHVPGDENNTDLFIKNLPGPTFLKHVKMYCGIDEYGKQGKVLKVTWDLPNPSAREGVSGSKHSMLKCSMDKSWSNESWSNVISHVAAKKVLSHTQD